MTFERRRFSNTRPWRRASIVLAVLVLAVSGCSSAGDSTTSATIKPTVDDARCQANKAAGQLTFLTGFGYSAAASILDVVTADELGYFKQMCLDIKLQPGFSSDNVAAVSSGRVAFTSLGSASEVANAVNQGAKLKAIIDYGHTSIEELVASERSNITALPQIANTTMGVLGTVPYSVRVMLARNGVPLDSFKQVQASYDPTLLDKNQFQTRPVYKSNEPRQLDSAAITYRVFDPATYDVPASFAVMVANGALIQDHPTVVADFVRADLAGYRYAQAHATEAIGFAAKRATGTSSLDIAAETFRWQVEAALVASSTPAGQPVGALIPEEWTAQLQTLVTDLHVLGSVPALTSVYDDQFVKAAYTGTNPNWP